MSLIKFVWYLQYDIFLAAVTRLACNYFSIIAWILVYDDLRLCCTSACAVIREVTYCVLWNCSSGWHAM